MPLQNECMCKFVQMSMNRLLCVELLIVLLDIYSAADCEQVTLLVLLDLTVAFDCIACDFLLSWQI